MSWWKFNTLGFLLKDIKNAIITKLITTIYKNPANKIKELSSYKADPP